MPSSLIAVFASPEEATAASDALVAQGFESTHIVVSMDLASDGVAAEWPGQAYANQSSSPAGGLVESIALALGGKPDEDSADAARMAEVQRGTAVLTLSDEPDDAVSRARGTLEAFKPVTVRVQ